MNAEPDRSSRELNVEGDRLEGLLTRVVEASRDDEEILQDLVEVARSHAGETGDLEDRVYELVQCVLVHEFGADDGTGAWWSEAARSIAGSLCRAPASRERLERLWVRLQERAT